MPMHSKSFTNHFSHTQTGAKAKRAFSAAMLLAGVAGASLVLSACDNNTGDTMSSENTATVDINATSGNRADGSLTLTQMDNGVKIEGRITGLTPGAHGFHVHQNGDCSNNAKAAGGHYNPDGHDHGSPNTTSHIGDLGNIIANATGAADISMIDSDLALIGEKSIRGRSFVVHQGADDMSSQPSGAAGARVGCGVIK